METFFSENLLELLIVIPIAIAGWGFKSWSSALKSTTSQILIKLDYLMQEFHQHKVDVERRVTRVETKVDLLHEDNVCNHHVEHHRKEDH